MVDELSLDGGEVGYYGDVEAEDLEWKKFQEKKAYVNKDWYCIDLGTHQQQFRWKHDSTLEEHTLYVREIYCWGTEPCEVKFKTESGKESSFGTFSRYPPHIFKMDCFFVKFQEDVTFSLFGAGPVQIFIDEIVKEESWWKGVKKVFNKYTWEANYFHQSKEKKDD